MSSSDQFRTKLARLVERLDAFVASERRSTALASKPHEALLVSELSTLAASLRAAADAGASKREMEPLAHDIKERLTWFSVCEGRGADIAGSVSLMQECLVLVFIFQEAEYADVH
jgi:hypothetical protein